MNVQIDREIGHLTRFDAFRLNRGQVMNLQTWFKIHTNVHNFETASPQTISTLIFFLSFETSVKFSHGSTFCNKLGENNYVCPFLRLPQKS